MRMQRIFLTGFAVLGLIATPWTTLPRAAPSAPQIEVGVDLLQTKAAQFSFEIEPIPPDFFGPGSFPFDQAINFSGSMAVIFF